MYVPSERAWIGGSTRAACMVSKSSSNSSTSPGSSSVPIALPTTPLQKNGSRCATFKYVSPSRVACVAFVQPTRLFSEIFVVPLPYWTSTSCDPALSSSVKRRRYSSGVWRRFISDAAGGCTQSCFLM